MSERIEKSVNRRECTTIKVCNMLTRKARAPKNSGLTACTILWSPTHKKSMFSSHMFHTHKNRCGHSVHRWLAQQAARLCFSNSPISVVICDRRRIRACLFVFCRALERFASFVWHVLPSICASSVCGIVRIVCDYENSAQIWAALCSSI